MSNSLSHNPVMLDEVITYLQPVNNEVYVDGTFGAGGYSKALLSKANCKIYAIDRDPDVQKYAKQLTDQFGENRFKLLNGKFSEIKTLLEKENIQKVNGLVLDLGVSSMQLDQQERGFSFNLESSLDMRMSKDGASAQHIVNNLSEQELADIIYHLGDERKARVIARKIVEYRKVQEIKTTTQLADIVRSIVGRKAGKIDGATRTFQAIRIWVNDELNELKQVLNSSLELLVPGGRLVVVTFHSSEDIIVKSFLREHSGYQRNNSRYLPDNNSQISESYFAILTNKAIKAGEREVNNNPRARSAKLRAALRTGAMVSSLETIENKGTKIMDIDSNILDFSSGYVSKMRSTQFDIKGASYV